METNKYIGLVWSDVKNNLNEDKFYHNLAVSPDLQEPSFHSVIEAIAAISFMKAMPIFYSFIIYSIH